MATHLRYIETGDLPPGFDIGDVIAGGTTGPQLIAWLKARVRDGNVPPEPKPVAVPSAPPKEKAPAIEGSQSPGPGGRSVGETDRSVAKPDTPVIPVSTTAQGNLAVLPVAAPRQAPPEPEELMLPPEYSDDSLAREFTRQYAGTFLFVSTWGRWLTWDGARWAHDQTLRAQHAARLVLREQANDILARSAEFAAKTRTMATMVSSARTISNVERMARSDPKHAAQPDQFDSDLWALNTPAGIVDLRTGEMRPATVRDFCTKVTRVAPGGDCPTWLRFLDDVTDGNVEMQQYLQRVAGYALTGSTREHALFFFYGTGRNGKGTFINTLEWIMGDYSRVASMETFTESKNERHSTEVAALMGARLVTSQEVDEGKRWAEARVKSMTGGDPITARFMRQDDFTFTPQFKLLISGNHRPGLRSIDEAMRARLHLIPFTITVPPERRDPQLADKLKAEAGGILAWAVEGCREWDRIRLAPPLVVRKATDEYFGAQDTVALWMAEECVREPRALASPLVLYQSYSRYCEEAGEYVITRRRFMDALELKGLVQHRTGGKRLVKGIRIAMKMDEAGPGMPEPPLL